MPFRKLVFPAMENGYRITAYRWRLDGPLDDSDISVGEILPIDSGAMVLEGILAIQAGSNPRLVAQKLQSLLPADQPKAKDKDDDAREVA